MYRVYRPHICIQKTPLSGSHINPGDTVFPSGGDRAFTKIGLASFATMDGRVSYMFAHDAIPATWVAAQDWPKAASAFAKRMCAQTHRYEWYHYPIDPIFGPSSQRFPLAGMEEDEAYCIEPSAATLAQARDLERMGLIMIDGDCWRPAAYAQR